MFGRPKRTQRDFSDELQAHLDLEMERFRQEGLSESDAYAAARRTVGNVTVHEEVFYESRRWIWFDHLRQDVRYTLRQWRQAPVFTLTAVLTLALGIGATTAIFTLVNQVMLKSLPVTRPEQLLRVGDQNHCCVWHGYAQDGDFTLFSGELYKYLRDRTPGFEELAAFQADVTYLSVRRAGSANLAETHFGEYVSGNYFSMLGVKAFAGRTITPSDDRRGAPPAVMMSYGAWRDKYGLDPAVIGSSFNLNGKPFVIAGVMPPGFFGETLRSVAVDFWIPLADEPLLRGDQSIIDKPDVVWLNIIGRVSPGAKPSTIESALQVELRQWLMSHQGDMSPSDRAVLERQTIHVSPGGAGVGMLREHFESGLRLLMLVSGFVLLIVCANMANLMLARGISRRLQTSLSIALGASRNRLMRQALTECVLLSIAGGAAGLLLAYAGARVIIGLAFSGTLATPINADPSLPVLLFAFLAALLTGVAFGVAPAWMTSRADPVDALRGAGRSTHDSGARARKALVVLQAALSLALICAAALLTQSLRNLENHDFGFATANRVIARVDPVLAGYKPEQLDSFYRQVHDRLAAIPGVTRVSCAMYTPMSGEDWADAVYFPGQPAAAPGSHANQSHWMRVGPGYFDTIGVHILRGRDITKQDTSSSRHIAVVNEAFVRSFFAGEDPIGKHFGKGSQEFAGDYEIVGVVADARYWPDQISRPVEPMYFLPFTQWTQYRESAYISGEIRSHYELEYVLETRAAILMIEPQIRSALAEVNPNLSVITLRGFAEQVKSNFAEQGMLAALTSLFGLLALVLATIGMYGITAYSVARRSGEIGIRMALGADRPAVVRLVLRGAFALVAIGLAAGIPLTLALGRLLGSKLYGVGAGDPAVIAGSVAILAACALVAALAPALRAASIAPLAALRTE